MAKYLISDQMRILAGLLILSCAGFLQAQTQDPLIDNAKTEVDHIRALVEAGAASTAQLNKAEEALADTEDAAILRGTLYGLTDLNQQQSEQMLMASARRLERREKAFEQAKKLVEIGAAAAKSIEPPREDLELARKERELAESRARLVEEMAEMAEAEEALAATLARSPSDARTIAEKYDGDGVFSMTALARMESAFEQRFGKPLPVSARGETAVHRALGFDHRGRVDVAIHPDAPEGSWLREYLIQLRIPFFAFRQAVPGKATGAHIHIGPVSTRLASGG